MIKKLLSAKAATVSVTLILSLIVVFHFAILSGIINYRIVWGGRLTSQDQMVVFETISILVNLLMLLIVWVKAGWVRMRIHPTLLSVSLWGMSALFLLNTFGNLMSLNQTEKFVFTPLTLLLAFLCFRLAIHKDLKQ